MEYNMKKFIFLPDPGLFQSEVDDLVALIPEGISRQRELCLLLKQQLHFPDYFENSWDTLYNCLSGLVGSKAKRVVIVHQDVPSLDPGANGREEIPIYLNILLDSIKFWEQKKGIETGKELVIIFPLHSAEQIRIFLELPPSWEMWYGFLEGPAIGDRVNPTWEQIQLALERFDCITVQRFSLFRKDVGDLDIIALWGGGYFLTYLPRKQYPHPGIPWSNISLEEYAVLKMLINNTLEAPEAGLKRLVAHFFQTEKMPDDTLWQVATEDDMQYDRFLYSDDTEAFLEWRIQLVQLWIEAHAPHYLHTKDYAEGLFFWQQALNSEDGNERLTALCVLGRRKLPLPQEIFLPFLEHSKSKERWVSARFLGQWKEPQVLAVLLTMLTEQIPSIAGEIRDEWYDGWRCYIPRLLRDWQDPSIVPALQEALQVNLNLEAYATYTYNYWKEFRDILCYELGYREVFDALAGRSLSDERVRSAFIKLAQGYFVRRKGYRNWNEEQLGLQKWWFEYAETQDILTNLYIDSGFSLEDGEKILGEYETMRILFTTWYERLQGHLF